MTSFSSFLVASRKVSANNNNKGTHIHTKWVADCRHCRYSSCAVFVGVIVLFAIRCALRSWFSASLCEHVRLRRYSFCVSFAYVQDTLLSCTLFRRRLSSYTKTSNTQNALCRREKEGKREHYEAHSFVHFFFSSHVRGPQYAMSDGHSHYWLLPSNQYCSHWTNAREKLTIVQQVDAKNYAATASHSLRMVRLLGGVGETTDWGWYETNTLPMHRFQFRRGGNANTKSNAAKNWNEEERDKCPLTLASLHTSSIRCV